MRRRKGPANWRCDSHAGDKEICRRSLAGLLLLLPFADFPSRCSRCCPFCDSTFAVTFSSCPASGREVMSQFNFDVLPLWANIVILASMTIVFRVVAYLALRKTTQP